jgi:hypothetical protein
VWPFDLKYSRKLERISALFMGDATKLPGSPRL